MLPNKPELYIKPILAFREWTLYYEYESLHLCSPIQMADNTWPKLAALKARCTKAGPSPLNSHPPYTYCQCGIYGTKIPAFGATLVSGIVALWGTVYEHEFGYRAQYAYPVVIFKKPNVDHIIESTIHEYGIEILPPIELEQCIMNPETYLHQFKEKNN